MSAEALLSQLNKVRGRGPGQWSACCPAHDDKGPSLSIKELADGRVLVHCFSSCSIEDVLAAVGLEMDALFPPKPLDGHAYKPQRRGLLNLRQCVELIQRECLLVWVAAENLAAGHALTDDDLQRLRVAHRRIDTATTEALA